MVLFISTWVRQSPSTGTNQPSPMDSPTPQDIPQPSCSYRRQERTPYWEWIRSNPSDSLSPLSSGSNTTSDDSEEDDYAFYYSHPERIIYHNHSPVHVARRRLCRAAAPTRRAFFRANQHERDSLATMVDDDAHDREHDYGFDQASLSCGSVGSDDTAAEDEQYIETLKDDVDNASLSTDQQEQDHPLAAKFDGFKERRRHRHKPKSKTPAATPSCTTKTLGSLGSGAKDGHEVKQDPVPAAHDGLRLRKSLSRLSIFRLFNSSERTP